MGVSLADRILEENPAVRLVHAAATSSSLLISEMRVFEI